MDTGIDPEGVAGWVGQLHGGNFRRTKSGSDIFWRSAGSATRDDGRRHARASSATRGWTPTPEFRPTEFRAAKKIARVIFAVLRPTQMHPHLIGIAAETADLAEIAVGWCRP